MRLVFGLVLVAGLGLAGFAVYMAQNYIGAYEGALAEARAQAAPAIATKKIYVTRRAIEYGQPITEEDIALAPWPEMILPEAYFDETENVFFDPTGKPRLALYAMGKHEAVLPAKVSEPGGDAGLTSRLQRGERAFAIKVDVASGVSGFLRPGDRVDVYWTGSLPRDGVMANSGDVTKLIQTGIRLIAIDQNAQTDQTSAAIARTVTIAASPQQIAALAQAQSTGRLSLSLLSVNDDTVAEAIEVDQRSLLGLQEEQVAVAPEEKPCVMRVRRGSEVIEKPIPCTN